MQCWKTRTAEQEFTLANKCQALKKRQNPEDQLLYLDSRSQIRYEEPRSLSRSRPLPPALKEMAHKTFLPFFFSSFLFFFFFFFFSLFPFFPSLHPPALSFLLSLLSPPLLPRSTVVQLSPHSRLLPLATLCITYDSL